MAVSRAVVPWPRLSFSLRRLFSSIPRGRRGMRSQGRSWERNSGLYPLQDDKHLLHPQTPPRKNHTEEYAASSVYEYQTLQMPSTLVDPSLRRDEVVRYRTYLTSSTDVPYLTTLCSFFYGAEVGEGPWGISLVSFMETILFLATIRSVFSITFLTMPR